ncbi:MAG: hypothetical protein M5T61_03030 [Acidimicrobiia bacterium]|nr:hypothetical protein [Acidimicrobiia bacterium]
MFVPVALTLAGLLLAAAAVVYVTEDDDAPEQAVQAEPTGAAGEIFLEPVASRGPDPFTDDVASSDAPDLESSVPRRATTGGATTTDGSSPTTASSAVVPSVDGGTAGLYGGTLDDAACDQVRMVEFLESHSSEATAWAQVQGIDPTAIREYVMGLTPVLLRSDTRVTNHGFSNGAAYPIQSVLQAGTAVLVDEYGVPRARCRCGNPLLPPEPVASTPVYTGTEWPSFQPQVVVVVVPAPQPLPEIVIIDIETGDEIARPTGTSGRDDRPTGRRATTTTGVRTTSSPGTSQRPQGVSEPNFDSTAEGVAVVSSIYGPEYPADLAFDGDPSTSWFADVSVTSGRATFRWTGARDDLITRVRVIGNAGNPEFPSGSGFASVAVRVLDASGDVVFEESVDLPGSPDPTIEVWPGVDGRSVELLFEGAEGGDLGGFAELEIGVTR